MTEDRCEKCDKLCPQHSKYVQIADDQEKRLDKLDEIVKEIPRMQTRVHTLMSIMIATMTVLVTISGFSFIQLVDFKKQYFEDRKQHAQIHSIQSLEQEQRYVELINKLGQRISTLEARHLFGSSSDGE